MKILEKWHGSVYCDAMLVMTEDKQTITWSDDDIVHLFGSQIERMNWSMRLIGDMPIDIESPARKWMSGDTLGQLWMIERIK